MVAIIILVIIFIVYASNISNKYKSLENENKRLEKIIQELKEENKNLISKYESGDFSVAEKVILDDKKASKENDEQINNIVEHYSKETIDKTKVEINAETNKKIEEKLDREKESREKKNTSILVTGALLIVLAAIVFLTSTWNAVPNVVKTAVIVLLVGVFLGASKIAKDKFSLPKTSNTFFYMAMAYIPICLISCSIFSLFGEYLSIYGEGNYIYLTISFVLTSCIYFIYYKIRKNDVLLIGSLISQVTSVVLFSLIFEFSLKLIVIYLLLYTMFLIIAFKHSSLKNIEFIKYFSTGIVYLCTFITLCYLITSSFQVFIILFLLLVNYGLLYKLVRKNNFNAYMFNIVLYVFGLYGISLLVNIDESATEIFRIAYVIIVFLIENILLKMYKSEKLNKSLMVVSIVVTFFMYIENHKYNNCLIKPFVIAIIEEVFLIAAFFKAKEFGKSILGYFIPICFAVIGCSAINQLNGLYHFYIIWALFTFVIGESLRESKELEYLNQGFCIISHIFIIITYLYAFGYAQEKFISNVIYFIILFIVYLYSFYKNREDRIFKYALYCSGSLCLCSVVNFLELDKDFCYLVPAITTVIITILEAKYETLKDAASKVFIVIAQIISYLYLFALDGAVSSTVFVMLFSIYNFIYNINQNEDDDWLRVIPLFGALVTLSLRQNEDIYVMLFSFIIVTGLTMLSIYKNKLTVDTFFAAIYLFLAMDKLNNEYINSMIFLIWSGCNFYFYKNTKIKDIFKGLVYLCALYLYSYFIDDYNLNHDYASLELIGILVVGILFIKTIILKYVKNTDKIEYIVFSLLYLFSIFEYNSEKDGMIFILAVIVVLVLSYMKKYGALFMVSLIAIIANALLLTREFWFSVPWWIYLLVIGCLLITFAIKNESDENKDRLNVVKFMKDVKDKIEK